MQVTGQLHTPHHFTCGESYPIPTAHSCDILVQSRVYFVFNEHSHALEISGFRQRAEEVFVLRDVAWRTFAFGCRHFGTSVAPSVQDECREQVDAEHSHVSFLTWLLQLTQYYCNLDRQSTYNVTIRRVRESLLWWKSVRITYLSVYGCEHAPGRVHARACL